MLDSNVTLQGFATRSPPETSNSLRLPRNIKVEVHQIARLLRQMELGVHQIARLPRKVYLEVNQTLRLPRKNAIEGHQELCLPRETANTLETGLQKHQKQQCTSLCLITLHYSIFL